MSGNGIRPSFHLVIHLLITSLPVLSWVPTLSPAYRPVWTTLEAKVTWFLCQQGSSPPSQTCANWQGLGHRVQLSFFYQPLLKFCTGSPGARPALIPPGKLWSLAQLIGSISIFWVSASAPFLPGLCQWALPKSIIVCQVLC